MHQMRRGIGVGLILLCSMSTGCAQTLVHTPLNQIYGERARSAGYLRNPIIVIPGVLGSKLVDSETQEVAWGKFNKSLLPWRSSFDANKLALPMQEHAPLHALRDSIKSDGTLAYLEMSVAGIPVEVQAYAQMMKTLGVGGYRDSARPVNTDVDYGDEHFTCFQFDYDWRRDISETAADLDAFIKEKQLYIRQEYQRRYGIENANVNFDVVAHSMGGLVARYYLRYGGCPLPDDGSLPQVTWAGAANVSRVVMIGTPNAGSAFAITNLVNGHKTALLLPQYPSAVLGTFPSLYQMLPRERHAALVTAEGRKPLPILDAALWRGAQWSLASPQQDAVLKKLLPDVPNPDDRHRIALDHQAKCLARAAQFQAAMDTPAEPPPGLTLHLFAGDSIQTPAVIVVDDHGKIVSVEKAPGDDTTLRSSALLDERTAQTRADQLATPIRWSSMMFLPRSHRDLTSDPTLMNNLLALLLDSNK